jgi:hypothetical protein
VGLQHCARSEVGIGGERRRRVGSDLSGSVLTISDVLDMFCVEEKNHRTCGERLLSLGLLGVFVRFL